MLWLVLAQLASATNGQVLVYGPTFNGNERTALNAAGYTNANIIVASATTWSGLSTSDFMKYDFIWVGDLNCSGPSSSAVARRAGRSSRPPAPTRPRRSATRAEPCPCTAI